MLAHDEQLLFDTICTEIGKKIAPLFVNWSVGQRRDVVAEMAARLELDEKGIERNVQILIERGWLTENPHIPPGSPYPNEPRLGVTHEGWQNWTYFSKGDSMDWNLSDFEEWLKWDGIPESNACDYSEVFPSKQAIDEADPASRPSIVLHPAVRK